MTDIDDPLLERAVATGQDWRELARSETALFAEDMEALNVLPPRDYIGAVESIPSVVQWIGRLRDAGAVYDVDGDLLLHDVGGGRGSGRSRARRGRDARDLRRAWGRPGPAGQADPAGLHAVAGRAPR